MPTNKLELRRRRVRRIRAKVSGTAGRPRVVVHKSNTSIYVQVIDDVKHVTMMAESAKGKNMAQAKEMGVTLAADLKKKHITTIVFDRGGFRYHGAVKALADALREGGITV